MKSYNYSVSTSLLYTSFDYGIVEAETREEAMVLAIAELDLEFELVNTVLKVGGHNGKIYFDRNGVELEEIKE